MLSRALGENLLSGSLVTVVGKHAIFAWNLVLVKGETIFIVSDRLMLHDRKLRIYSLHNVLNNIAWGLVKVQA